LKRLGIILHITPSRNFIVKLEFTPEHDLRGAKVVVEDMTVLGVVKDIIGPVASPLLVVGCSRDIASPENFKGKVAYLIEEEDLPY